MITETVRRAQAGDHAAFAELYGQYHRRVLCVCARITKRADIAEDLTQETFLQAYTHLGTYRGEAAFGSWLYSIAYNTALMKVRRRKRPVTILELDSPEIDAACQENLAVRDPQLASAIDRMAVDRAVATLSHGDQMLYRLRYVYGLEQKELASYFRIPLGTLKPRLSRLQGKVAKQLKSKRVRRALL